MATSSERLTHIQSLIALLDAARQGGGLRATVFTQMQVDLEGRVRKSVARPNAGFTTCI